MLTIPTPEQAQSFMRSVELKQRLQVGILTPMAGSRPLRLYSLQEVETFLVVQEDIAALLVHAPLSQVHYAEPRSLAAWVRQTIGDVELADSLDEIVASRKPYGFLVPEIKALLAERIAQCEEVLEGAPLATG